MITIFTPTYNRAHLLPNLYSSLCSLTTQDFEWLIVDDGSSDNTRDVVNNMIHENKFVIRYIYQTNGGKFRAINRGVKEANGELFFIVDSDDTLVSTAIDSIFRAYNAIKNDPSFAGVSGLKGLPTGKPVGGYLKKPICDWYMYERDYNFDMAEVYKTDVLLNYPFPDFENEKFCPEGLVWNRIGLDYKVRYFNEVIYNCEYLEGGLTKNSVKNRRNNPTYITLLYKEKMNGKFSSLTRIRSAINYWRFWFFRKNKKDDGLPLFSYLYFPIGFILKIKDDFILKFKY